MAQHTTSSDLWSQDSRRSRRRRTKRGDASVRHLGRTRRRTCCGVDLLYNNGPQQIEVMELAPKSLSTLSRKSATVAEFGHCRRCLAVFCDSRTFLRQCGQGLRIVSTVVDTGELFKKLFYYSNNIFYWRPIFIILGRYTLQEISNYDT